MIHEYSKNCIFFYISHLKYYSTAKERTAIIHAIKKNKKEERRQQRIESQILNLNKKKHVKENTIQSSLASQYDPKLMESKWYQMWEENNIFNPDFKGNLNMKNINENIKNVSSMVLPPPNITGSLHLGHVLGCSIQDALCRWQKLRGREVLWVPGSDHAGIATQVVVEKEIFASKGLSRFDLGREKFLDELNIWKEKNNKRIFDQLKMVGASLDWSRSCFTLDQTRSYAVTEAFIRLYKEGFIYRDTRLVNWSCSLQSTISDIEVENLKIDGKTLLAIPGYNDKVAFGVLSTFKYPLIDSDHHISVSTTRLETIFGDTAIAVYPLDTKYSKLIGQFVLNPLTNNKLPIVADDSVDPTFGTGAVKVTPAHDPTDFLISRRHHLPSLNIINDFGKMENVPQKFMGLPRFLAREKVKKVLIDLNLFERETDHCMTIPKCSRSGDVVEYRIKPQWFVKCKEMADKAIEAVESGKLVLLPEYNVKLWYNWLQNTGDWCISRQLWWGHRVPAYRVIHDAVDSKDREDCSNLWVVGSNEKEALDKAVKLLKCDLKEVKVSQDEDVLDTWFSSALFPFSCFGWPRNTPDFLRYYPLDLMETAGDILFFWVARMVMLGQQLTGKLPFKKVLLHSIVCDRNGKKMSKSLGNVIDPLHVISGFQYPNVNISQNNDVNKITNIQTSNSKDMNLNMQLTMKQEFPAGIPECGADALRMALLSANYTGHYLNMDMNQFISARHFCNKIWQAARYVDSKSQNKSLHFNLQTYSELTPTDKWILSRLSNVVAVSNSAFESFKIYYATKAIRDFVWLDLCDVYLEYSKLSNDTSLSILKFCFEKCLLLLYPISPFISEELYHHFNPNTTTISFESYPDVDDFIKFRNLEIEDEVKYIQEIAGNILTLKTLIQKDYSMKKLIITNHSGFKDKINLNAMEINLPVEAKQFNDKRLLDRNEQNIRTNDVCNDSQTPENTPFINGQAKNEIKKSQTEEANLGLNMIFIEKYLTCLQALIRIKSCNILSNDKDVDLFFSGNDLGGSIYKEVILENNFDFRIYLIVDKK